MPAARRPLSPPPPRALRLAPIRSAESVQLDNLTTTAGRRMPPFVRWDRFLEQFTWSQGQHVTIIGPTGSGKTVLARLLLRRRDYVVVLGVKNRDPELYGPFQQDGYQLRHSFEPEPPAEVEQARILYVPRTDKHGTEGRAIKARKFRGVLNDIFDVGYWATYADDIEYMVDALRLGPEFEELWMLGRSEGVSVIASSQEPVNIPVMAYGMATHLFLFSNEDLVRAKRMAELTGMDREIAQATIMSLPPHEFLYLNRQTRQMVRSRVIR